MGISSIISNLGIGSFRFPYRLHMIHRLKTVNPWFQLVWQGKKNFEVRFNDRDFQRGDQLVLCEYVVGAGFTGLEVYATIGEVFDGREFPGIVAGYVVLLLESPAFQPGPIA